MDRMQSLIDAIKTMIDGGFTGHVKINFTQGSIGRVEKIEELEEVTSLVQESSDRKSKGHQEGHPERSLLNLRRPYIYSASGQQETIGSHAVRDVNPFHGDAT